LKGYLRQEKKNQISSISKEKRQGKVSNLDQEEGSDGRVCLYITSYEREGLIL